MIIGYARVSDKSQRDNNSFEQQEGEILARYENAVIVKEQFTGKTTDRPIFNAVVEKLKANDILVVTKLDRFARNTEEGIHVVKQLFAKGVAIHVLNIGLLEDTTMGRFFLTTMLAVAEMERCTILERTRAGKEIAKQKDGYKEGRPKKVYSKQQVELVTQLIAQDTSIHGIASAMNMPYSSCWRLVRTIIAEEAERNE